MFKTTYMSIAIIYIVSDDATLIFCKSFSQGTKESDSVNCYSIKSDKITITKC